MNAARNNKRKHLRKYIPLLLISVLLAGCSNGRNKHNPITYFPVQPGNTWIFDGDIHKMEITAITAKEDNKLVTLSVYDSLDVFLWKEK